YILDVKVDQWVPSHQQSETLIPGPRYTGFEGIPTSAGEVHSYQFDISSSGAGSTTVAGGYDGGGQRPRDVNKFLTYAFPNQAKTQLSAGATKASIFIFYGATTQ